MTRQEEINIMLKDLLSKIQSKADYYRSSDITGELVKGSRGIVELSKDLEKYLDELKNLKE